MEYTIYTLCLIFGLSAAGISGHLSFSQTRTFFSQIMRGLQQAIEAFNPSVECTKSDEIHSTEDDLALVMTK